LFVGYYGAAFVMLAVVCILVWRITSRAKSVMRTKKQQPPLKQRRQGSGLLGKRQKGGGLLRKRL
jgi:hypothetical protein